MKKSLASLSLPSAAALAAFSVCGSAAAQSDFGPPLEAPFRVLSSFTLGADGEYPRGFFLKDSFAVAAVNDASNVNCRILAIVTSNPLALEERARKDFSDGTWSEAFVANGKVYNGFRFGAPKATELFRTGDVFSFGDTTTLVSDGLPLYHWRGWGRVERPGPNGPVGYVVMSDALTSASLGGLYIFDESGQEVGKTLGQFSGEDMVIESSGRWAFQIDNGDRTASHGGMHAEPQSIRCWDLDNLSNPQLVGTASTDAWAGNGTGARDLVFDATESYVFVSGDIDGLRVVDISNPAAPFLIPSATRYGSNRPNKRVRGLVLYQPDMLAMTASEDGVDRVSLWDVSDPTSPRKVRDATPAGVTRVTDLDVRFGVVYATVVAGGIPQMQVWY